MRYVKLGKTGVEVSALELGCMSLRPDKLEESKATVRRAYDLGINFFDTADVYGPGDSEIILGTALKETNIPRDEIYIADEAFFTGTAAEITPIKSLDDRTIGDGKPGPVTKKLQDDYFAAIKGQRPEYSDWLTYL